MTTHDHLLQMIFNQIKAVKIAERDYDRALNNRIAAQRKADEVHAILCSAKSDLEQAMSALSGSIEIKG